MPPTGHDPREDRVETPAQLRELAIRARVHALLMLDKEATQRLLDFAAELEAKAQQIERRMIGSADMSQSTCIHSTSTLDRAQNTRKMVRKMRHQLYQMRGVGSVQGKTAKRSITTSENLPKLGGQSVSEQDEELLKVCTEFREIERKLDLVVDYHRDQTDEELISLHDAWSQALTRATEIPARTIEGWRAKAAMLLSAMAVILGPDHQSAAPHELLAASLARDVTEPRNS